jgi:hypothetical protein
LLVRMDDGVSNVLQLRSGEANDLRLLLADLGVRLEDVFGFDSILWPRWTVQNPQLIDRQNQQFLLAAETGEFYFAWSSVRKSVWTLVRQLRGPHLSTWA